MPQFTRGNYSATKKGKTFAERYRWTNEEKLEALEQLQNDPSISPKPPRATVALEDVPDSEPRFGMMGHYATGFRSLDKLCLGFDRGDYVVLGAGTNNGKTQLALYIAAAQRAAGVPVLYISRELSNIEIKRRFMDIGIDKLSHLSVPDSNRLSPDELLVMIKAFQTSNPGAFIIIDHLHAFFRGENLTEALGLFSASLRELAQDLQITILALAQFNREKYSLEDGPTHFQIKESGYIADDAYTILLAWRTKEGLNIRLAKSRRLDMNDLPSDSITLLASQGKLQEGDLKLKRTFL